MFELDNTTWLWLAAGLSALTFAAHTFTNARTITGPLLAADLEPVSKFTTYYCWHMVTVMLLAMTASFAAAAYEPTAWELGALSTGLAAIFAVWSIVLIVWKKQNAFLLPQWTLFAPIAVLGILGLL